MGCNGGSQIQIKEILVKELPDDPVPKSPTGPSDAKTKKAKRRGATSKRSTDVNLIPLEKNVQRLTGLFSPTLTSTDFRSWQIGDPRFIKIVADGLSVGAGQEGNLLLTRRADYYKCSIKIKLAASKRTEAFVALRARPGPDGWHAITSRFWDDGVMIKTGMQRRDFTRVENGMFRKDFAFDQSFEVHFKIAQDGSCDVFVNGERTAGVNYGPGRPDAETGAVGLFVRSGTVVIKSLIVSE